MQKVPFNLDHSAQSYTLAYLTQLAVPRYSWCLRDANNTVDHHGNIRRLLHVGLHLPLLTGNQRLKRGDGQQQGREEVEGRELDPPAGQAAPLDT